MSWYYWHEVVVVCCLCHQLMEFMCWFPFHFHTHTDAVGLSGAYFGEGEGLIFLDDADCSASNHSNLAECFDVETDVGTHNCAHSEDAGVICQCMHACMCESC